MHGDDNQILPYSDSGPPVSETRAERDAENVSGIPARYARLELPSSASLGCRLRSVTFARRPSRFGWRSSTRKASVPRAWSPHLTSLRGVLGSAVGDRALVLNPAAGVNPPRRRLPKRGYLTIPQVEAVAIEAAMQRPSMQPLLGSWPIPGCGGERWLPCVLKIRHAPPTHQRLGGRRGCAESWYGDRRRITNGDRFRSNVCG